MTSTTAIFYDPIMMEHRTGPHHPESPERLWEIAALLDNELGPLWARSAPAASVADAERIHTPAYVASLLAMVGKNTHLDADTVISPGSVDAAFLAAGHAIAAARHTCQTGRPAFALVRPPGHHAAPNRGMGFCLLNNIAIAARYALDELGIRRVLIVDWDVHHGNGTQDAFYDRRDVLFYSSHQSPLYPGTGAVDEVGAGHGAGYTINIPFPAGTGDDGLLAAMESILVPAAGEFEPDLLLVSAGFDAHRLDPIGGMRVSTEGFAAMTAVVSDLATRLCGGRLALILEGGYHRQALARTVARCLRELQSPRDEELQIDQSSLEPGVISALQAARGINARYWPILP